MDFLKAPLPRTFISLLALSACMSSLSAGGALVEEAFGYADGALIDKNGGHGFDTAWTGSNSRWTVASGVVTITGAGDSTAIRSLAPITSSTTASVYFSFDLSVLASTATGGLNDAIVFQAWNGTTNVDVFAVGIAYNATTVQIRSAYNGGTYNNFANAADLAIGTTNTIVGRFSFAEGATQATLSLWFNPADESAATFRSVSITTPTDVGNIGRVLLRRQDSSNHGANVGTAFDNIRIGADWVSATTAIPEPDSVAVVVGGLALAAGAGSRRRR